MGEIQKGMPTEGRRTETIREKRKGISRTNKSIATGEEARRQNKVE